MADVVQYKLERMVSELDDLERRNLFSRREISEIVKKRRNFEYRLKRPSPLKHDFLAYIEYEKNVDQLRLLRTKMVSNELKKQGNKRVKKSVCDFAGVTRIVDIYRLATNRFKGDVGLWFQYLEFCRQRRNGHMKKVLAQVIRFHPKVPGVWIYAAAWEFDYNLNATAARALMQSGLRACPNSEDLWIEYIRMELTYLNKLKSRKVALGEDEGTLVRDPRDAEDKQWRDENKALFMALDEKKENDEAPTVQKEDSEKKLDLLGEQALSILRTVYSGAVEALPSSFSMRTRFFEILEATDLPHSEEMRKEILADLKRDFSKEPEYWDWLARHETVELRSTQERSKEIMPDHLQKAILVYEEGLKSVPSSIMFNLYTKFLMDAIVHKDGETQNSGDTIDPIPQLLKVYEMAESMECIAEDLACQHISLFLELGRLNEARELAEKLCNGKLSHAVDVWVLHVSLEMRCIGEKIPPSKADMSYVFELVKNVISKVPSSKAENLWHMALKFFAHQRHYFDKLIEISSVLLAQNGGSDDGFSLSSAIANFVLQNDGIQRARDMYNRYLALPHPGLVIYKNCINLELNLASVGDKDCLAKARKIYESALTAYDKNVSLWQDYYSMECKMGTSDTAAAVHWRARKTLGANVALLACKAL